MTPSHDTGCRVGGVSHNALLEVAYDLWARNGLLDIVQSFPFIFLLYFGSHEHMYIYISPICNVVVSCLREYNKN